MNLKPIYKASVFEKADMKADKKKGVKENSKKDKAIDAKSMGRPMKAPTMKNVYKK
jgi:hypothetical protein